MEIWRYPDHVRIAAAQARITRDLLPLARRAAPPAAQEAAIAYGTEESK